MDENGAAKSKAEAEVERAKPATLAAIRELAKRRKAEGALEFTEPETGLTFTFRRLTGADVDKIISWAQGSDDKYNQIFVEEASVDPKVTMEFWAELQELGPMVRGALLMFVREISGMGEDAVERAKNACKPVVGSN